LLLSGMAAEVRPAAALPNPLHLSGNLHGSFKAKGVSGGSINANGNVSPIGKVTLSGKVVVPTASGTAENLTASTKKGKAFISAHVTPTGTTSFAGTYTINGGTKSFAGESGGGNIVVSLNGGRFTATFS